MVGFNIWDFFSLTREERTDILQRTEVDLDEIEGIEHVWIRNMEEMKDEIFKSQSAFFNWLKKAYP